MAKVYLQRLPKFAGFMHTGICGVVPDVTEAQPEEAELSVPAYDPMRHACPHLNAQPEDCMPYAHAWSCVCTHANAHSPERVDHATFVHTCQCPAQGTRSESDSMCLCHMSTQVSRHRPMPCVFAHLSV